MEAPKQDLEFPACGANGNWRHWACQNGKNSLSECLPSLFPLCLSTNVYLHNPFNDNYLTTEEK